MRRIGNNAAQTRAFTVLELLVTFAVVGILVGLLLPALMAAREAARRAQCSNNLREIGVAIQQYHQSAKRLPEAWIEVPDGISGYGWAVGLLAFLEEANLQSNINHKLPIVAVENATSRNTRLPIMLCPSDISDETFELFAERKLSVADTASHNVRNAPNDVRALVRLPAANYLGVFGTVEADDSFPAPPGDGSIISRRRVTFADLERGQSHTILIGERTTAMVPSTWLGVNFHGEDAACRLVGSAITAPNCASCDECEFASRHSGGSNFVWADGHVSMIAEDIEPTEYQRLAKRRVD